MYFARYFPGIGLGPEFADLSQMTPETTRHMRRVGDKLLLQEEKNKGEHTKAIAAAGGVRFTLGR